MKARRSAWIPPRAPTSRARDSGAFAGRNPAAPHLTQSSLPCSWHSHHPAHAKFVRAHAKQRRPKRGSQRHLNTTALLEGIVDSLDLGFVLRFRANLETAER